MLASLLLALAIRFLFVRAAIPVPPKPPAPRPHIPDPPTIPRPPVIPHVPVPNPNPGVAPNGAINQAQMQANLARVELSMQEKLELVGLGQDIVEQFVSIFMEPSPSTTTKSATLEPSTTIPAASYAQCYSFASKLNACASATTSFFVSPPRAQASCACYTAAEVSRPCTGSTTSYQTYQASSLATVQFDSPAGDCQHFLQQQGFNKSATAMRGKDEAQNVMLGADFCTNLNAELGERNSSLHEINDVSFTRTCDVQSSSPEPPVRNAASRSGLTGSDRAVFILSPSIVAFVSLIVFG